MSVLHSPNSISLLAHEWWLDDVPEEMLLGNPSPKPSPEPPSWDLEWCGESEYLQEPCHPQHSEPVDELIPPVRNPPSLKPFSEGIEELSERLDLNDEIKKRSCFYLPYLRPRMGERSVTCAAMVFLGCFKAGAPRSLQEVALAAGVTVARLRLRIKLIQDHAGEDGWCIKPELLLPRYCAMLDISFETEKKARQLIRTLPTSKRDPMVVAASALVAVDSSLSPSRVHRMIGIARTSVYNFLTSVKS